MKIALVLLCLLIAACMPAGRRGGDAVPAIYDLGAPPPRSASAPGLPPLALEVRVAAWFDSPGIAYRLAYDDPARLRQYAQARWAGPPASLVGQRLAQQPGLVAAGSGAGNCLLRIDIDEFAQVFDTPQASRGVVQARLTLHDRGRRVLADAAWRIERPAATQDSRGGVGALSAAVEALAADLLRWRGELAAQGRLNACSG